MVNQLQTIATQAKEIGLPSIPSLHVTYDCGCTWFYGRNFQSGELWEVKKECLHCRAKKLLAEWQEFQLSRNT